MKDALLVVPMHIPRSGRLFIPLSILITVGFLIWMTLDWSRWSAVLGLLWIVCAIFIWGIVVTNHRVLGGRPMQLVADADGIHTAGWSVRWDRIDRMWVGSTNGLPSLNISVSDPRFVERPPSLVYSIASGVDRLFGLTPIRILEANIDRPVDVLLEELKAVAPR